MRYIKLENRPYYFFLFDCSQLKNDDTPTQIQRKTERVATVRFFHWSPWVLGKNDEMGKDSDTTPSLTINRCFWLKKKKKKFIIKYNYSFSQT